MRAELLGLLLAVAGPAGAATYWVDGANPKAADTNAGTAEAPWKTVARAGKAAELKPGDTVLIRSGVYREHFDVKVSGEEGRPITFAAAPGAIVLVKGSEVVRGKWSKLKDDPNVKEPFPNAFSNVWKIQLGEEYFTDPDFPETYKDKSRRWISEVVMDDQRWLQQIGPDRIYSKEEFAMPANPGRGIADLFDGSFFFDPADQTLYLRTGGDPGWYNIEVGVRGWTITASKVHDVVIRGLQARGNRQPGGQWPMASIGECERVTVEGCRFYNADFCGLGMGRSKQCVIRNCDCSFNGDTGIGMGQCEECTIEGCTLLFNNLRRFSAGWHTGGMKCIPANKSCTVRNCEAAYNTGAPGIWFDAENADIRILDNVCHHNGDCGIFFEINKGGGVIAGNLCYANGGRGIYLSGSQKTWIVHNTVADNVAGIVCMPREDPFTLDDVHVLNNLLLGNYRTQDTITRGCDLTLFMDAPGQEWNPGKRRLMTVHSDYNVYANTSWTPFLRHSWNPNNTIEQWRERFGEDLHSTLAPVGWQCQGTGFRLNTLEGLDVAGPLPERVTQVWKPRNPKRAGADRTRWPE